MTFLRSYVNKKTKNAGRELGKSIGRSFLSNIPGVGSAISLYLEVPSKAREKINQFVNVPFDIMGAATYGTITEPSPEQQELIKQRRDELIKQGVSPYNAVRRAREEIKSSSYQALPEWQKALWSSPDLPVAAAQTAPGLARLGKAGISTAGQELFKVALNKGLDRWIATQGRNPEGQSALGKIIVGNKTELIEKATNNLLARLGRSKNVTSKIAEQAATDTINELGTKYLTKFTQTNTGVPGQTLTQSQIIQNIFGQVPQTAQAVQAGMNKLGSPAEIVKGGIPESIVKMGQNAGFDVEAVRGIKANDSWVALSPTKDGGDKYLGWMSTVTKGKPNEELNKLSESLKDRIYEIKRGTLTSKKGGFLPFRNIQDATTFLKTGDTNLILKELKLEGSPITKSAIKEAQTWSADLKNKQDSIKVELKPIQDKLDIQQKKYDALELKIDEIDGLRWASESRELRTEYANELEQLRKQKIELESKLDAVKKEYSDAESAAWNRIIEKQPQYYLTSTKRPATHRGISQEESDKRMAALIADIKANPAKYANIGDIQAEKGVPGISIKEMSPQEIADAFKENPNAAPLPGPHQIKEVKKILKQSPQTVTSTATPSEPPVSISAPAEATAPANRIVEEQPINEPPGGVVPPVTPPTNVPPSQPPSAPVPQPSYNAMKKVVLQAKEMVKQDRPGKLKKLAESIQGIGQLLELERPGLRMTGEKEKILVAYIAEQQARIDVNTRASGTYFTTLSGLDKAFGKGATEGKKLNVRFVGTSEEGKNPIAGTLKDIAENPEFYALSEDQLKAISNLEQRNTTLLNYVVDGYGTEIGQFPAKPQGAFLSNVDISDEAIEKIGTELRAVASGRQRERFYPTARERMAADPTFKPELNIRKLIYGMDSAKAKAASGETFRSEVGGKSREEVMAETHPELYNKMMGLKKRLVSLQGSAGRLDDKLHKAVADFLKSPNEGEDLLELQSKLDVKLKSGPRKGLGPEDIQNSIDKVRAEIKELRPAWEIANLKPYEFVKEGIFQYFKTPEAKEVRQLLQKSVYKFLNIIDNIRGTAFSGDLSPVVGVQTPLGIFFDPIGAFMMAGGGIKKAIETGNPLVSFSISELSKDIQKDPEEWSQFFSLLGRSPGGTPAEFAGGYLSKIPGFSEFTEATYTLVTRQAYGLYQRTWTSLVKSGMPELQAKVSAITTTARVFPFVNPTRLGQSPARAAIFRTLPTSYSFIRQPLAMINDAAKGIENLLIFKRPTPSQGNALRLLIQLAASLMVTAAISQAYDAHRRKADVKQAILDSINPDPQNGKFLSLVYGKYRVPIGGPYRSIFRAIYPKKISGVPVPIPFAGFFDYIKNRITPAIGTQIDLLQNKDYYGKKILSGDVPTQIWQVLEYELEGMLPLTVGSALEGWRTGQTREQTVTQAVSQFAGASLIENEMYEVNNLRDQYSQKDYGKKYQDLNQGERDDLERNHPDLKKMTDEAKKQRLLKGSDLPEVYAMLSDEAVNIRNTGLNNAAQSLIDGKITKEQYDSERGYIRPYYSGQRNALYRMKEKLDPEKAKQIEEYYNKSSKPEDKAVDAYWDYYNQVLESSPLPKDWNTINNQINAWLAQYDKKTQDYITKHLNDWIKDLPEPAKSVELERMAGIEDGSWWDGYRGKITPSVTSSSKNPFRASTGTKKNPFR